MKNDDPKLTAYALNELPALERAEIERMLREDSEAGAEIHETREMAGILERTLHNEPAPPLAEHQRWAIMRLAGAVERDRRGPAANERSFEEPQWWRRVGVWQAIAACAVFGFGVYAISDSLTKSSARPIAKRGSNDMIVGIPSEPAPAPATPGALEVLTPIEMQKRVVASNGAGFDPAKVFPNGAVIVPPQLAEAMKVEVPKGVAFSPSAPDGPVSGIVEVRRENDSTIISIPDAARIARKAGDYANVPGISKPVVTGSSGDMARASMARGDARPPTDEAVGTYLMQRMREAERVREGSTAAEFFKVFRADAKSPGRYEMIRCNSIKVDAGFVGSDGAVPGNPPSDDARLKTISKPYLELQ